MKCMWENQAKVVGVAVLGALIIFFLGAARNVEFRWVNPLPEGAHERLSHGTFFSQSMGVKVGYVVYLPDGYGAPDNAHRRYPVVYYLHGGRQGSEVLSISMTEHFDRWISSGRVPPRIYVFVNGGKLSHYDYRDSLGETAFVKELVPHIDRTYRTIRNRSGRAIEGASAGGRGTARIMFKYPELFGSAVPIAGGHQHEKYASENDGWVRVGTVEVALDDPRNNTWDLARQYAGREDAPPLSILVVVGTDDFNYETNLEWMAHLESLGIPFERRIVPEIPHSAKRIYQKLGDEIMQFHEKCFVKVVDDRS